MMAVASFRYLVQLHRDVPKAARFYSDGIGFTIDVCTLRWAELHSGPLKIALLHSPGNNMEHKGYSSLQSFTVTDINSSVTKLMTLGAELDGPIKHEIHGKVAAMKCADGHVLGLYEPCLKNSKVASLFVSYQLIFIGLIQVWRKSFHE